MNSHEFLNEMKNVMPEVSKFEAKVTAEFYPAPPGINTLCSHIGRHISKTFSPSNCHEKVFLIIEAAMTDGTDELKDAVATGMIEAIISECDKHPGGWEKVSACLEPLSKAYALAWIKFTETGSIANEE